MSEDVSAILESLYEQKHAFYFRRIREWLEYCKVGPPVYANYMLLDCLYTECFTTTWLSNCLNGAVPRLLWQCIGLLGEYQHTELLEYICESPLFDESEKAMHAVAEELQRFGERCMSYYLRRFEYHQTLLLAALPMFLADEKERATTRYLNITTIATFFSSVTATVLQTSLAINPGSTVWDVVNLFWFISLVFSVSSGVSSLLGMTWRKSKMWVDRLCSVSM